MPIPHLNRPLTRRHVEILGRVSGGAGTKEIARTLGISSHTVKDHIKEACFRLSARNRTHAVALWMSGSGAQ